MINEEKAGISGVNAAHAWGVDGYSLPKVFDLSNGPVAIEDGIDTNRSDYENDNYIRYFRVVEY